jgi:LacI family transcriptional regulator
MKKRANKNVATLTDVAKEANVSTATVSRCLNSPEQVDPKTHARVMIAVENLSYAPNFGAKIMAERRSNTVGAVIPTMENSIFARGIQAFQEELSLHGYTLLVASSSYQPDIEEKQIRNLVARGAEALLLIGYQRDGRIYQFLKNRRLPFVITWAFDQSKDHLAIGFDNQSAMEALAEKVINLGHKDIGLIIADTSNNDRSYSRLLGIKNVMKQYAIDESHLAVEQTTYAIESGAAAFETLMKRPVKPTVVMCGNDVLAVGAINKAKDMGLKIPEDISITGFDDIELSTVIEPNLTTVHVPHRQMGRRSAQTLINMINTNQTISDSEELSAYICMRDTLGNSAR